MKILDFLLILFWLLLFFSPLFSIDAPNLKNENYFLHETFTQDGTCGELGHVHFSLQILVAILDWRHFDEIFTCFCSFCPLFLFFCTISRKLKQLFQKTFTQDGAYQDPLQCTFWWRCKRPSWLGGPFC